MSKDEVAQIESLFKQLEEKWGVSRSEAYRSVISQARFERTNRTNGAALRGLLRLKEKLDDANRGTSTKPAKGS